MLHGVDIANPRWAAKVDFALKTLGFATAVTFGVWAPWSFYVASKWNRENDVVQKALLANVEAIRSYAPTAAAVRETGILAVLQSLETHMQDLKKMQALQYCDDKAEKAAICEQLTANLNSVALISSLGSLSAGVLATTTLSATDTPNMPTPSLSNPASSAGSTSSPTLSDLQTSTPVAYPPLPGIMDSRTRSAGKTVALVSGLIFAAICAIGFVLWVLFVKKAAEY